MSKPTVTQLLDVLNKPALMKWANRIGLNGVSLDAHRQKSFAKGRAYHSQVEDYILKNKEIDDPTLRLNFHAFFDDTEILDCEKTIDSELYKGRYDIRFRKGGEVWLCDFKTNAKGVYFENRLQLAAYDACEDCDRLAIISLPSFEVFTVKIDRSNYRKMLQLLSEVWALKRLIG